MKDPYRFDFLTLGAEASERELESALVKHITHFLLELGAGFAFVGRQVHLEVGGDDFYLDLLFYHLKLRAYVVVELKTGDFKPEHTGQLGFYLSAVDAQKRERRPGSRWVGDERCEARRTGTDTTRAETPPSRVVLSSSELLPPLLPVPSPACAGGSPSDASALSDPRRPPAATELCIATSATFLMEEPRMRFHRLAGNIHMLNNFHKTGGSQIHGVGKDMALIAESCVYQEGISIWTDMGSPRGWKGIGNEGTASDLNASRGTVFSIPYPYTPLPASKVVAAVTAATCGAGNTCRLAE